MALEQSGDYYNFGFRVYFYKDVESALKDAEGNQVTGGAARAQLTSTTDSTGGQQTTFAEQELADLRNFAAQLVLEGEEESGFMFTLTLTPPYEDAVRIIENELISFNTVCRIQYGYFGGNGSDPLLGRDQLFIVSEPKVRFGLKTEITLTGYPAFVWSATKRQTPRVFSQTRQRQPIQFLELLAQESSCRLDYSRPELIDTATSSLFKPIPAKESGYVQKGSNFAAFVEICQKNNAGFFSEGVTLVLYDKERVMSRPQPDYRLLWMTPLQGPGDIPISTVDINANDTLFAGSSALYGQRAVKDDLDTQSYSESSFEDDTTLTDRTGGPRSAASAAPDAGTSTSAGEMARVAANPAGTNRTVGEHKYLPAGMSGRDEMGRYDVREAGRLCNHEARVVIPGHPLLKPTSTVALVGVTNRFSDFYLVVKARHELGARYTTTLDLLRRGVDRAQGTTGAVTRGRRTTTRSEPTAGAEDVPPKDADGNPVRPT